MKWPSALQHVSNKKGFKPGTKSDHGESGQSSRANNPESSSASNSDYKNNIANDPQISPLQSSSKRDSGYVTATSRAPSENVIAPPETTTSFPIRHRFTKRPVVLKRYQKIVPEGYKRRFLDLKLLFEEALCTYLRRKHLQCQSSSITLMFLGEDDASVKPYVLITCDEARVGPIRFFFSQTWIKEELKPDRKFGFPHFELHISPKPPQPASGSSVYVYGNNCREQAHWDSLGGVNIAVQGEDGIKAAKLGGTIQCISANGDIFVRGLTVGHIIAPWRVPSNTNSQEEEGDWDKTSHLMPDMSVDDFSQYCEDDDNVKLDINSTFKEKYDFVKKNQHQEDWETAHVYIGCTCEAPQVDESGRNLDYALVVMDGRTRYRPAPRPSVSYLKPWTSGCSTSGLGRPVTLVNQSVEGDWVQRKKGRLARETSSLLLAPGFRYAETYRLVMDTNCKVSNGDCGSWVLDQENGEVYGQLVATDTFDDAHVMPLPDIFQDIKQRLGLAAIALTIVSDALQLMFTEGNSGTSIPQHSTTVQPLSHLSPRLSPWESSSSSYDMGMELKKAHVSPRPSTRPPAKYIKKDEFFRHVLWKWRQSRFSNTSRPPLLPSPPLPRDVLLPEKLKYLQEDASSMRRPSLRDLKPSSDPVDMLYPTNE